MRTCPASCYGSGAAAMATTSLLGPVLGAGFAQVIVPPLPARAELRAERRTSNMGGLRKRTGGQRRLRVPALPRNPTREATLDSGVRYCPPAEALTRPRPPSTADKGGRVSLPGAEPHTERHSPRAALTEFRQPVICAV